MSKTDNIDKSKVPAHIAVIMDGNGRWAQARGLDRTEGHKAGVDAVRRIVESASQLGVKYLTLYAFSTENWNRPTQEVDALMELMVYAIARETADLVKNGVRLQVIGDLGRMPAKTREALNQCLDATKDGQTITLILALSYSSKWELTEVAKQIAQQVADGKLAVADITDQTIDSCLQTQSYPDPDLLIRTGGEQRLSNFLLWQTAYSEFYFSDVFWPDFDDQQLREAVLDYQHRIRRFGKTTEQVKSSDNK